MRGWRGDGGGFRLVSSGRLGCLATIAASSIQSVKWRKVSTRYSKSREKRVDDRRHGRQNGG